jgi:hypothetical protein
LNGSPPRTTAKSGHQSYHAETLNKDPSVLCDLAYRYRGSDSGSLVRTA